MNFNAKLGENRQAYIIYPSYSIIEAKIYIYMHQCLTLNLSLSKIEPEVLSYCHDVSKVPSHSCAVCMIPLFWRAPKLTNLRKSCVPENIMRNKYCTRLWKYLIKGNKITFFILETACEICKTCGPPKQWNHTHCAWLWRYLIDVVTTPLVQFYFITDLRKGIGACTVASSI